MKPGLDALMALPLFAAFDRRQLSSLNDVSDLARVGPGEQLFADGDKLSEVNFLVAGQVAATRSSPQGSSYADVLLPVRPLCLPAAMLGLPAPIGVRTLTAARLVVVPVESLHEALAGEPAALRTLLECCLHEAHELTLDLLHLKLRSSPQRLAVFLLGLIHDQEEVPARFVLPFEKRLLAARIGCSQENLSRAFASLRRIGVETKGPAVVVRDVGALRLFAESPRQRELAR